MGQIDQPLHGIAGAAVRTVRRWRSRGISWKVITSNLLPVPSLSIIHHQLLPSKAGNAIQSKIKTYKHTWILSNNYPTGWSGQKKSTHLSIFSEGIFCKKMHCFFLEKLLKWQEFRLLRRSDLRQWLKFSCMKPCRIHVWIIHDMIYTQWLCMIFDHIHSYHGMNLAIRELWSLVNDAFSTSYQRKANQVTDHFW